jgi:ribonuclease HII
VGHCRFCGVDEAGKGAVIGPLVVAGAGCSDDPDLTGIAVRDSKTLSPRVRETLFTEIQNRCICRTIVLSAEEIDRFRSTADMNDLMARNHAGVVRALLPDVAYIDACDVNAARHGRSVAAYLDRPCRIHSSHKAENRYPLVAAASIVAKVTRDREIEAMKDRWGDIGSGYPSDPQTVAFLCEYIRETGEPPACARWSWKTVTNIMGKLEQRSLSDF